MSDLPCAGRRILLRVVARRFRCSAAHCRRKIFAEFADCVLTPRSRRTMRLECIVHHLGLALGGNRRARTHLYEAANVILTRGWREYVLSCMQLHSSFGLLDVTCLGHSLGEVGFGDNAPARSALPLLGFW